MSEEVYDLDLVDDHGFVSKVNNWFRDSQRERSQSGSIASYEDERLHTVSTDCTTIELPWMFGFRCGTSIAGRCTIKSESLFPPVTHRQHASRLNHIVAEGTARCAAAHSVTLTKIQNHKSAVMLTANTEDYVSTVDLQVQSIHTCHFLAESAAATTIPILTTAINP